MTRERLYIVHGMGRDAVGLVGRIAAAIASARGNIVDLRQDVLHGLFTVYLVVDLSGSDLRIEGLQVLVGRLGEDTGLAFSVDAYHPVARSPEKKNLLVIVLGPDRPGIIASVCETLGRYGGNIESARTVARAGVFVMELLSDIGHATLPLDNLKAVLREHASAMGVRAAFQTEDVFNKRKRIILFDLTGSFLGPALRRDVLAQTGSASVDLSDLYSPTDLRRSLERAAARLEGLPVQVVNAVVAHATPTPETMELLQTLKIMGYRTALACDGFAPFTEAIPRKLAIDYSFGVTLPVDDDSGAIIGTLPADARRGREGDVVRGHLTKQESVDEDDITVVSDLGAAEPPGIRLSFDLEQLLGFYNTRVLSRENVLGLLGSFGIPSA